VDVARHQADKDKYLGEKKKIKQNISAEDICLIKMKTIPERAVALK
jgi:hypothetical protein